MVLPDLVCLEQRVNDRLGTDPPPLLPAELLPEAGVWRPLAWVRVPRNDLKILSDAGQSQALVAALDGGDDTLLFPVHPLIEHNFAPSSLLQRGRFAVSASYRTVFFEPDPSCLLKEIIPTGHIMMIKLHLDHLLPGIPGDRRLTPDKVTKCIELSALLPKVFGADRDGGAPATILREQFGLIHGDRGALIRFVPRNGVVPAFSLYSNNSKARSEPPILVSVLNRLAWPPTEIADRLADWFVKPILSGLLAGFRQGFSLEMHGQNTLLALLPTGQIGEVFFRDLESVVFFPELRERHGLERLELEHLGPELFQSPRNPVHWFNRNIDHDIGRTVQWALHVLEREGVLKGRLVRVAKRRIQQTARHLISCFGLDEIARQGRWLPFSRSPYGNGLRRGHYYRTRYR